VAVVDRTQLALRLGLRLGLAAGLRVEETGCVAIAVLSDVRLALRDGVVVALMLH
jgi:hypothetical protein